MGYYVDVSPTGSCPGVSRLVCMDNVCLCVASFLWLWLVRTTRGRAVRLPPRCCSSLFSFPFFFLFFSRVCARVSVFNYFSEESQDRGARIWGANDGGGYHYWCSFRPTCSIVGLERSFSLWLRSLRHMIVGGRSRKKAMRTARSCFLRLFLVWRVCRREVAGNGQFSVSRFLGPFLAVGWCTL